MGFLKIIQNIAVESVLHHLAHALSTFLIGDKEEIYTIGQAVKVNIMLPEFRPKVKVVIFAQNKDDKMNNTKTRSRRKFTAEFKAKVAMEAL